ncbi:TPA: hypothetical protein N0F65_008676 [Lagenidium giganteum]|uniref:Cilia- and flagella-associated protein 91 n=1 Tax=Lagenidium giganteum TaxID=4803 RepID=A0AAV2ZA03_9STRA|nr:TPA: hypothetical protein N0F65_008676 [Lagenidium giganteum]
MVHDVVVLGGGISGLSLAFFLRQAARATNTPARIRVVEAAGEPGGWVRTAQRDNFLFEEGPRGFRPSRNGAEVLRLVEQLQLQKEMVAVDAAAKARFILHHGRVQKVPDSISELLQWPLTWEVAKAGLHECFTPKGSGEDESIYDFAVRRFSPVVAECLLDPMTSGIFGGDIRKLSMRSCFGLLTDMEQRSPSGSIVRAILFGRSTKAEHLLDGSPKSAFVRQHENSASISFRNGMSTIVSALHQAIKDDADSALHFNTRAVAIERDSATNNLQVITHDSASGREERVDASAVYATIPSFQLVDVVRRSFPELAAALQEIHYVSMGMVHAGYHDKVLTKDGFGYLIPSREAERVAGVVFDSNAFPVQNAAASPLQTRLTVMSGGAHFPDIDHLPLPELESLALDAVRRHLDIDAKPDFLRSMVLRRCIPQYHVGFHKTLDRIHSALAPGLVLGGNSYYGVGLADCVNHSKKLALDFELRVADAAMSRTVPSRALDAVYDPLYTVSHSHGSYRKSSGARAAVRASVTTVGSSNQGPEGYALVSGSERPKFFKRPVLPHLQADQPEVLFAPIAAAPSAHKRNEDDDHDAPTRTVGVQTVFRDSEAQTDPYTPDFTIKKGAPAAPEIATLLHLRHKQGLPAGQAEVELIERNRKKKAFQASLPPMTDEASFVLRKAMMEAQEIREWAYREAEIDALHEQRIELLQQALVERDKENEFLAEQRIEALRQRLLHEKENAMERIQQERVTALRKLTKKRQHGHLTSPKRDLKRDIIGEYASFSSKVYAPTTRTGKTGKATILEVGIEKEQFRRLDVLQEFEGTVPARLLASSKFKPPEKVARTAKERKQQAIEAHLLKIESIIKKNKEKNEESVVAGNTGPTPSTPSSGSPRKRAQQQQAMLMNRPPTPEYVLMNDGEEDDEVADAVRLIQKLIRGRAVQNMMFEGKERRAELIQELRASDEERIAADNALSEEEARMSHSTMAKAEGEVVSEMLDFLYKELDRSKEIEKMREFVEHAAEERRQREVEEGGRRQAEDLMREREDEVFRRIELVHQETCYDFINDVIDDVVAEQAHHKALGELHVMTDGVASIVTTLEQTYNSDEVIVKDLVASFLFPQVQRQNVRDQVAQEQRKFVSAAHALLTEVNRRINM